MPYRNGSQIITRHRTGTQEDPFLSIRETHVIDNSGRITLSEIPNQYNRVEVTTDDGQLWYEVTGKSPVGNEYVVDYQNRFVEFHISNIGKQVSTSFLGMGLVYLSTDSIYTQVTDGKVTETLKDLTDTTAKVRDYAKESADIAVEAANTIDVAVAKADTLAQNTKYDSPYDPTATYQKNNIVSHNGSSFMAKQTTTGNLPPDPLEVTENDFWGLVSRKGADGTGTVKRRKDSFIATEGQRVFNLQYTYDQFQDRTSVYVGGVPQSYPAHYEETTDKSITLSEGVPAGTEVIVEYFSESIPLASDIQTAVDNHTQAITANNNKIGVLSELTTQEKSNLVGAVNEHTAQLAQTEKNIDVASKRTVNYGKQAGRNIHIYQWGSPFGGNDWCFVRTPDSYSINGKPHPLVVLNHGNGWIMDGTEAMANFSDKTQFGVDDQNNGAYLDTTRPDYVQYSSPLIEALLAEGYVVCGAQNDGQHYGAGSAGYGNAEVRQNIKFFFEHMVQNYNVKDYCHMVGASNGCMATLNASFIMREKIRSIILLYPLTNLYAAWKNQYQQDVADAYHFTSAATSFSYFRSNTSGHDPMATHTDYSIMVNDSTEAVYANANFYRLNQDTTTKDMSWIRENRLIDDAQSSEVDIPISTITIFRRSLFAYPRIRCHYSMGDTVLPQEEHWLAFQKLLLRGANTEYYGVEVTGNHGDYTHFEDTDGQGVQRMITWMKL